MFGFFKSRISFDDSLRNNLNILNDFDLSTKFKLFYDLKIVGPLSSVSLPESANYIGKADYLDQYEAIFIDIPKPDGSIIRRKRVERRDVIHLFLWFLSEKIEEETGIKADKRSIEQKERIAESAAILADGLITYFTCFLGAQGVRLT